MDICRPCLVILIIFINIAFSQKIMQNIDDVHQVAGTDAELHCITFGLKDSNVAWQRYLDEGGMDVITVHGSVTTNNPKLPDGREKYAVRITQTSKRLFVFSLTVRQLVADDSGIYRCVIMKQGEVAQRWPSVNGTLLVQYPPRIRQGFTSSWVDVAENGTTTLSCLADGVPQPRISWIRANGLPFKDGSLAKRGRQLHLPSVDEHDRGVYRCRAENNVVPSAHADIMVDVHFKPRMTAFRSHVGQSPGMNLPAELTCLASGKPQPVMTWYKREGALRRKILNDQSHHVEVFDAVLVGPNIRDGDRWFSLHILNIQQGDFGTYECEATNDYGTSHAEIRLFYTPTCQGRGCTRRLSNMAVVAHNGAPSALPGAPFFVLLVLHLVKTLL